MPSERPWSARIRERLRARDRRVLDVTTCRPAAVLIPIFEHEDELHILFTLRTDTLRHHRSQVAFPGGARHVDDGDLRVTALRESEEEIGLSRDAVDILGALDDVITISYFQVTPWVARIPWPVALVGNEAEIADIFTVPLPRLLDPALCSLEEREIEGRPFYPIYHFEGGRHRIWGITGNMLARFLELCFDWRHPDLCEARVNLFGER